MWVRLGRASKLLDPRVGHLIAQWLVSLHYRGEAIEGGHKLPCKRPWFGRRPRA